MVAVFQYAPGIKTTVAYPWGNIRKVAGSDEWESIPGSSGVCTYYAYYYLSDFAGLTDPVTNDVLETLHIGAPSQPPTGGGGGGGPPWDPPATPMGSIGITFG